MHFSSQHADHKQCRGLCVGAPIRSRGALHRSAERDPAITNIGSSEKYTMLRTEYPRRSEMFVLESKLGSSTVQVEKSKVEIGQRRYDQKQGEKEDRKGNLSVNGREIRARVFVRSKET